jgi:fucose permease
MPTTSQRRITSLAYLAMLLEGLDAGWFGPFLPQIAAAINLPLDRAGLLISAVFAGFLVAVIAAAEVVDRFGARVSLAIATVLMAMGLLRLATAHSLIGILGAGVVVGLGHGIMDVASHVLIAGMYSDEMTSALNRLNAFFAVGALIGPLIVGFALSARISFGYVFAGGAVIAAATAALTLAGRSADIGHQQPSIATSQAPVSVLTSGALWILGGVLFLFIGVESSLGAWLFTYMRLSSNASELLASWSVSVFWIGLLSGRLLGSWISQGRSTRDLTASAAFISLAGLAILSMVPSQARLQIVLVLVIGIGCGPLFPNAIAMGAAIFPRQVSAVTSRLIALGATGGIVIPWLVGKTLVGAGPRPAMLLMAAITSAMLLLIRFTPGAGSSVAAVNSESVA